MVGKAVSYQFLDALAKSIGTEQMYGHVKIAHAAGDDSTDGVAVSPDAVHAYCPAKGMAAEMPAEGDYLTSTVFTRVGDGRVSLTKNGQLCVTGTIIFSANVPANTYIDTLAFDNALKIPIPCLTFWGPQGFYLNERCTFINEDGFLNGSLSSNVDSKLSVIITPGIYPIFANKE